MDYSVYNRLISFIWSIADDCLRDVYVRGKYRDVILPMVVLRRLDALLEPTKAAVMEEVCFQREEVGLTILDPAGLQEASGYVFYNISEFTLTRLAQTATNNRQILEANCQRYLDGFSENVKEIIDKFKLRAQVKHMAQKDVLLDVLEKFTSPTINLTPNEAFDPDGRKLPPLTNLGMGYVFEELIRKFNEENNEEAGEHFTPREVIKLMTHLVFEPVREQLPPVILVYDGACGSGGMLTEAQNFITDQNGNIRANSSVHLYGVEVNDETYAICKSDMMIKGNDPENIKNGSTLATDMFAGTRFDFMLSNPPYGKSWKSDMRYIREGKDVLDPRFRVRLNNFQGKAEEADATPRSSDGQLLFLMDMVSKMKSPQENGVGSRIASVHNGSSLFTGDAGSGESNIRRAIIENDWLEAIIQLPNNLFYNTGITTYIWLLSNNKPAHRRGWVQLIDASSLFRKLRKNLGAKNCELAPEHIETITRLHQEMVESDISRLFRNEAFGYYKATVERPLRLAAQFTPERIAWLRFVPALQEPMAWAYAEWGEAVYTHLADHKKELEQFLERQEISLSPANRKRLLNPESWRQQRALLAVAERLLTAVGSDLWLDFSQFSAAVDGALADLGLKLAGSEKGQILNAVSWRDPAAQPVVKKVHKLAGKKLAALPAELACQEADLPDFGYWPSGKAGEYVEYEADSELRDTENVPLTEDADPQRAVHGYFLREVRPHVAEAWLDMVKTKIGYEISFNKYFYRHTPLRSLAEVTAEILQLEAETEGLLKKLVAFGEKR
jgi:type I restriction enzyme M protein